MNKAELISAMAAESGLTKADCQKALDAFTASVIKTLKEGGKVSLVGFGTFSVKERAERSGINPTTKEKIVIPARKEAPHNHFRVDLNEIYALRIDDITFFADQNKMTFEYDDLMGSAIIFKDIIDLSETKRGRIND